MTAYPPELSSPDILRERIATIDISPWVTIDKERIRALIPDLERRASITTEPLEEANASLEGLELAFFFNAANFAYWPDKGEPKWSYKEGNGGSEGFFRALEHTKATTGWRADAFATMQAEEFDALLGNPNIPMKKERLENIQEAARCLMEASPAGTYQSMVDGAEGDALKLLTLLVEKVPCYRDVSLWENTELPFLKRAQLLVKTTHDYLYRYTGTGLSHIQKLTAFSDYKVPYVLAQYGILRYEEHLAQMLRDETLIPQDAPEEVAIRIATVLAVMAIKEEAAVVGISLDEGQIDTILWLMGREKTSTRPLPFHRTRTRAY